MLDLIMKMSAQIYQCMIIVCDTNRMDHFRSNRECSCEGQVFRVKLYK